jgi:PBP1b-binding outer membrane lipoprotein LpoB
MMANWRRTRSNRAIIFIFFTMLLNGCAGGQTSQQVVSPLYMLTTSGFQAWDVNDQTPKRQALMNSIPGGKIVAYTGEGAAYYVYADTNSNTLYVGDEATYQKYLSMTKGKQLCERMEGQNQQEFWGCFVEFQAVGAQPRAK